MRAPLVLPRRRRLTVALVGLLTAAATVCAPPAWAEDSGSDDEPAGIVQPMLADSSEVPCAPGTTSLDVERGFLEGKAIGIHLCAIPNLTAARSAEESTPGSSHYIQGADQHAVVNSRISGALFAMVEQAKADGVTLLATSSFRTERQQKDLYQCYVDQKPGCLQAADPGYSNHQMGLAVDFALPQSYDTCDGGAAKDDSSWKWLKENAADFGFRQMQTENWHWDTSVDGDYPMCD